MGAGTIGLLAALVLRLRGLEVTVFSRDRKPNRNAELIEMTGARYVSVQDTSILDGARQLGPFDLIFEATGFSPVVFDGMQAFGKNGVLVLSSITGGDRKVEIPGRSNQSGFRTRQQGHGRHRQRGTRELRRGCSRHGDGRSSSIRGGFRTC